MPVGALLITMRDIEHAGLVEPAADQLQADGTIAALNKQYLGIYNSVPMLKP